MRTGPSGMVFDRALTPELFDVALRVVTESSGSNDSRRLLTVALRDYVSAQEAEGKTKKCLSRIWVSPPESAREMIRWAIDHQDLDPERTVLHLGALLATFPFAGTVTSLVGRQLYLEGAVNPLQVRSETTALLGDRSTIDVGARKVVTTLRYLGLLTRPNGGRLLLGRQPKVHSSLSGWVTHALLLTRQVDAVGVDGLSRAFELATLKLDNGWWGGYPLLELHAEGSRTVVTPSVMSGHHATNGRRPGAGSDSLPQLGLGAETHGASSLPQSRPITELAKNS
jgi:hypothetical protein